MTRVSKGAGKQGGDVAGRVVVVVCSGAEAESVVGWRRQ